MEFKCCNLRGLTPYVQAVDLGTYEPFISLCLKLYIMRCIDLCLVW